MYRSLMGLKSEAAAAREAPGHTRSTLSVTRRTADLQLVEQAAHRLSPSFFDGSPIDANVGILETAV